MDTDVSGDSEIAAAEADAKLDVKLNSGADGDESASTK
jgi:hypothetical protein